MSDPFKVLYKIDWRTRICTKSSIRPRSVAPTSLEAFNNLITGLAIGHKTRIAAFTKAGWIKDRPIFDFKVAVAGQFLCAALACGGQGNDQIEGRQIIAPIFHLVKAAAAVSRQFNLKFLADRYRESVDIKITLNTRRLQVNICTK